MPVTSYISVGGRMISEVTDGVILDYVPDALGSIHSVIDQDANVVKTMRYKPYGEVLSRSGTVADRHYQWVGSYGYRATFAPSSSHYVRARHYTPTAGSWTTVDPLWPDEKAYGYVGGRATIGIDSTGSQVVILGQPWYVGRPQLELWINPKPITSPGKTPPINIGGPLPGLPGPSGSPYPITPSRGECSYAKHERECNRLHDHYKKFCTKEQNRVPKCKAGMSSGSIYELMNQWCNCCEGRKEWLKECPEFARLTPPGHISPTNGACKNCRDCMGLVQGPPHIQPMPWITPPGVWA